MYPAYFGNVDNGRIKFWMERNNMEENGFKNFTIGVILPGVFAENYRKEYSVCYAHFRRQPDLPGWIVS